MHCGQEKNHNSSRCFQHIILQLSASFDSKSSRSLLTAVANSAVTKQQNNVSRDRAKRRSSLTPITEKAIGSLSSEKAIMLDMDHVYVKFADFLWAYTFIGPFSFLLWKKGTIFLRIRKWLQKLGLVDPQSMCDYEALAATLCLEQSQVINYCAQTEGGGDSQMGNVAGKYFIFLVACFQFLCLILNH